MREAIPPPWAGAGAKRASPGRPTPSTTLPSTMLRAGLENGNPASLRLRRTGGRRGCSRRHTRPTERQRPGALAETCAPLQERRRSAFGGWPPYRTATGGGVPLDLTEGGHRRARPTPVGACMKVARSSQGAFSRTCAKTPIFATIKSQVFAGFLAETLDTVCYNEAGSVWREALPVGLGGGKGRTGTARQPQMDTDGRG
jgi:hypothetical protein